VTATLTNRKKLREAEQKTKFKGKLIMEGECGRWWTGGEAEAKENRS
jgi:hypothetical protein